MSGVQLPYMRHTLRMFGMLTGIGVIVLSLYIFITWSWGGVQGFVSRLWNLVFGILMLMAEIDAEFMKSILAYLAFLTTDFGRGLFFIFVGTQVLANPWWEILVACLCMACGVFHIIFAMMCEGSQPDASAGSAAPGKTEAAGAASMGANPFTAGAAGGEAEYGSNYTQPATPADDNPFSRPRNEHGV